MRADDDVDLATGELRDDLLLLLLRAEPADHVDLDREAGESIPQRAQMLEGQDGRRRQKRDLLAVDHGLECGAHRHFGLAVAHVAAEQAVHRRRGFEVAGDVSDRRLLIDGEVVLERVSQTPPANASLD